MPTLPHTIGLVRLGHPKVLVDFGRILARFKANERRNPISGKLEEDRLEQFMAVRAEISTAKLQDRIDRPIKMRADGAGLEGVAARSVADTPEIDVTVLICAGQKLKAGRFIEVVVKRASEHALYARLAHPMLVLI